MSARINLTVGLAAAMLLAGCDSADDGEATVRVSIYGEDFIEDRIPADEVVDGWDIEFSTFLVSVSDIAVNGEPLDGAHLFDIKPSSGGEGHAVGEIPIPAGSLANLEYRVSPAPTFDGGNGSDAQQQMMSSAGYSIYVEGTATRGDESKTFAWGFATDTSYVACELDGQLEDGEEGSAEITIHGDHLFFDDLDSEEPSVAFDIMARADADTDGEVTEADMTALDITGEARYQVGSRSISDLWAFVETQATLVGHVNGEGHCDAG